MNSRQRVLAILNRQAVDRPAFDLGGTDCSSVHVVAYKKLRHFFKLPERPIRCGCLSQSIAEPDRDLLDALGADAEALSVWLAGDEAMADAVWRGAGDAQGFSG